MTPEQAIEELQRRGITVSTESVLEEKGTTFDEFKKGAESLLKGSAKGIVNILGGWGNLYDYLKGSKDPSAFSSVGIARGIKDLTGVDVMSIPGYRGAYEFGEAGAPAAALSAAGLPGLFGRSAPGVTAEFGVAGGTGVLASSVAPDSPLAQFVLQSSPYAIKGGLTSARGLINRPSGEVPANIDELLRVGRMTPGQATGSRAQLATEARTEAATKIGEAGNLFRQAQAQDVTGFLDNVFKRSTSEALDPQTAANTAFSAFNNYGKALSSRLRSDASKDFRQAKASGGMIDTTPVLSALDDWVATISPEVPGFEAIKASAAKIRDEYFIPAKEAEVVPSTILGPTGSPAAVRVTPATPAGTREISIDRLQKNLSAWGEAAYSGKADFGKGNIFEGVAPGQAKGAALSILRGFRDALDQAIDAGVPGAEKLKAARDNFKSNLAKIEEFSNYPLVKYFDMPTATSKTPEEIIARMQAAKPSERILLANILKEHPEGYAVFDTIRRNQLETLLDKSRKAAAGAAEGSPDIDLKTLLKELNNKKGDFNYLFPDPAARQDALLAIQWLQKTAKKATEFEGGAANEVYATTRGLGGTAQQGLILRELTSLADVILRDSKAAADVIFNPDTVKKMADAQRKGKLTKAVDLVQALGVSAAKFAPRVGPMVETTQPIDTTQQPQQAPQITPEDALRQLQMMGITVEE